MMADYLPLIGITADVSGHPEEMGERAYMARCNYADAIRRAGGISVILPYDADLARHYVPRLDGLLVTGGRFDLPPAWYGGGAATGAVLKEDRSIAERALLDAALAGDLPILGVCNGMQLLGVMHGAAVIEHIPHDVAGALEHMAAETPHQAQHDIVFTPGAALGRIAGQASASVNSVHHQALLPGGEVLAAAVAWDGVVEAIEIAGHRFCFGLQWHPEYEVSPTDTAILKAFVAAAKAHREQGTPAMAAV